MFILLSFRPARPAGYEAQRNCSRSCGYYAMNLYGTERSTAFCYLVSKVIMRFPATYLGLTLTRRSTAKRSALSEPSSLLLEELLLTRCSALYTFPELNCLIRAFSGLSLVTPYIAAFLTAPHGGLASPVKLGLFPWTRCHGSLPFLPSVSFPDPHVTALISA